MYDTSELQWVCKVLQLVLMKFTKGLSEIIYVIHIFTDWLIVCHVNKNKLTILQKLLQSCK